MPNRSIRNFAPLDIVLIVFLLALSIAFWPFFTFHGPGVVVVYRDNAEIAKYSLDVPNICTFQGALGPLTISIGNKSVRVIESGCPKGICIQTGAIKMNGQQIVCAPNHILITVVNFSGKQVDGITQ